MVLSVKFRRATRTASTTTTEPERLSKIGFTKNFRQYYDGILSGSRVPDEQPARAKRDHE